MVTEFSKLRLTEMKIKLKSLAAENSIIRKEENRLLRKRKEAAKKMKDQIALSCSESYNSLSLHRKNDVRRVTRVNHLAYCALRGVAYAEIESKCKEVPNFKEVVANIRRFSNDISPEFGLSIQAWIDAAIKHLAAQGFTVAFSLT